MNESMEKLIRELSQKLGTTAEHLWGVLTRQAQVTAITDSITVIILLLVCIFGGKYLIKGWKYHEEDGHNEEMTLLVLSTIGYFIIFIIAILCTIEGISSIPTAIMNPEYWALKQIVK